MSLPVQMATVIGKVSSSKQQVALTIQSEAR